MNKAVTEYLDSLNHPLRKEIEVVRKIILNAHKGVEENIKWNGPNYHVNGQDRVSIKVLPPKQIMIIFHRGAKVQEQPKEHLLAEDYGLLEWRTNDRALAVLKDMDFIEKHKMRLVEIVKNWWAKTL